MSRSASKTEGLAPLPPPRRQKQREVRYELSKAIRDRDSAKWIPFIDGTRLRSHRSGVALHFQASPRLRRFADLRDKTRPAKPAAALSSCGKQDPGEFSASPKACPAGDDDAVNLAIAGDGNIVDNPCGTGSKDFENRQQRYVQFPREKLSDNSAGISVWRSSIQAPDQRLGVEIGNRTDSQPGERGNNELTPPRGAAPAASCWISARKSCFVASERARPHGWLFPEPLPFAAVVFAPLPCGRSSLR